jgi:NADH-quinone oxidoreductase subunit E/NADP-reducing hydrogenase subunit HndA
MVYSLIKGAEATAEQAELRGRVDEILSPLERDSSNVIVALQKVQGELGWLPLEAFLRIASHLRVSPSEVFGAATFYAQFYLTKSGRNRIMACRGTACHVKGAARVLRAIKQELGIEEGETTPDEEFTLETVACIGACALAPTMMVNKETHGKLTPGKALDVLSARRTGAGK